MATKPIPTTVTMMPTAITVTIHPQTGVSYGSRLSTLSIGTSDDGMSVSVESLIWAGAFAGGVDEDCDVYEEVDSVEECVAVGVVVGEVG